MRSVLHVGESVPYSVVEVRMRFGQVGSRHGLGQDFVWRHGHTTPFKTKFGLVFFGGLPPHLGSGCGLREGAGGEEI